MTSNDDEKALLSGLRILEVGPSLATAVTGRMFAELGADVIKVESPSGEVSRRHGLLFSSLVASQNAGKRVVELNLEEGDGLERFTTLAEDADLVVVGWHPTELESLSLGPYEMQKLSGSAVLVYITPFGLSGPDSHYIGSDLVVLHSSGLAKRLVGPVENPDDTPPVRAYGQQSEFIAGAAAACAGMFGLFRKESSGVGAVIDISMQESLAYMNITGLSVPSFAESFGEVGESRKQEGVPGPNLTILPAVDGFVAISPREELQWKNFLKLLGDPEWGSDQRFADRGLRQENSEAVIGHLSDWSRTRKKMDMFQLLQENRIPCYPMLDPADHLDSEQLARRGYFKRTKIGSAVDIKLPGKPFRIGGLELDENTDISGVEYCDADEIGWGERGSLTSGHDTRASSELPLNGLRVADLSWVIAGPTSTRYLASMGAEVVKVETSSRPDPGRIGQLHDVLGQGKLGITLDLKSEAGLTAIKKLIETSDVLIENFAPGVMERLGLGWDVLKEINPKLVMVSASGTGQTGPTRQYSAYGTLLQIYTGFAGLNGYPGHPTSIGMAWIDPLCGMLLAYAAIAALRSSRGTGVGRHIDFSMVEAMLSTLPEPLIEFQMMGTRSGPMGNDDAEYSPHGVFRCVGEDAWVAIAVTGQGEWESLANVIGATGDATGWDLDERRDRSEEIIGLIEAWTLGLSPDEAARELQQAGVPSSASRASGELVDDEHLRARGFFDMLKDRDGVSRLMPTLPWRWIDDHAPNYGQPPALGGDTRFVLKSMLGYSDEEIQSMADSSALN